MFSSLMTNSLFSKKMSPTIIFSLLFFIMNPFKNEMTRYVSQALYLLSKRPHNAYKDYTFIFPVQFFLKKIFPKKKKSAFLY